MIDSHINETREQHGYNGTHSVVFPFPSPTITRMYQIAGTAQSYDWMVYPPINTALGRCPCLENCSVYTRGLQLTSAAWRGEVCVM
jgi:hypothetical protein